ncbi:MAG: polymerase Rpb6 [Acidobacteriota bacterium]|jgi:DNA-directed RNA polymerase subunit omega|nr:polymerase Rpb6 [Acidobacteriota bacterium]
MSKHVTKVTDSLASNVVGSAPDEDQWPGIDSRYRLIIVAALRSKQLQRGAHSRIVADPRKRRNTSIALEEVKQGLVHFTITDEDKKGGGVKK